MSYLFDTNPDNELNLRTVASKLASMGYPIVYNRFAKLTKDGHGPPCRKTPRNVMVEWDAALAWAQSQWGEKEGSLNAQGASTTTTTVAEAPEQQPEPMIPMPVMHDQIIYYCKTTFPDRWKQLQKMHGPQRKAELDEFCNSVMKVINHLFRRSFAELAPGADCPTGKATEL